MRRELGVSPATAADGVTKGYVDFSIAASLDAGINAQTGTSYTLVASDDAKVVTFNNASNVTVTIPADTFPLGSYVELVQIGAGQVTLVAGTGVTLNARGGALKINGQYGVAGIRRYATNTFVAMGDLTT